MSRRHERGNRHLKNREKCYPPPVAVLDTNVFVEIHTCHDLRRDIEELYETEGIACAHNPAVTFRIARQRESTLLAMYLAKRGLHTYSLRGESLGILSRLAPPVPGGTSLDSDFVRVFAHFIGDYVLRGWKNQVKTYEERIHGDACDLKLIDYAKRRSIPVITHEGYTRNGIVDDNTRNNMRSRCKQAGVEVFAPREFYAGKIDEAEEIEVFLDRFKRKAPVYLADRGINDKMGELLDNMFGLYRLILRGEVEGLEKPVATRLV